MKDLEKIKSEDLGCQVADANPGNFAIEQEVGAMVGATVPAPTEPSADDARELGAQLLVFLRRALLPIRSALRTALAAIYAHLDSRCTAYTPAAYAPYMPLPPYDPMRPFVPRTLPNLLTALTAFSARKISNGSAPNDGIPDGTSLAHILCGEYANITKLIDDNDDWVWDKRPNLASFPNLEELSVNAKLVDTSSVGLYLFDNGSHLKKLTFAKAKSLKADFINRVPADCEFYAPEAEYIYEDTGYPPACKVMYFPKLRKAGDGNQYDRWFQRTADLPTERFVVGSLISGKITNWNTCNSPRLIDFEVGADGLGGLAISLDTSSWWNPTYVLSDNPSGNDLVTDEGISTNLDQFLQNFKEHIALRLTSNGSGLTLTLSQAVRDAIHAAEATYGIEAIIVTQKGWTLSPAPTA